MNLNEQSTLLQEGGFSQAEITEWKQGKIKTLQEAGFTNQEISDDFKFEPDTKVIKDYVNKITKDYLSQDIVIPEDEMLYQSNLNRGKPVKQAVKDIKETVIGKNLMEII